MSLVHFAKKLKDIAPTTSPKFLLHRHLSSILPKRSLNSVHGSDVTQPGGICARQYALVTLTEPEATEELQSTSQTVTYELGHLLEARIINWFADMGVARTNWQCYGCGSIEKFCGRPPDCRECGCLAFHPINYRYVSKKTGVSVGIDLHLFVGNHYKLVEIKTMAADEFKTLAAPLAEHRIRTNLYMRTVAESEDPIAAEVDTDEAYALYVAKGGFGIKDPQLKSWGMPEYFSPFKEFTIKRDDKDTNDMVKPALVVKQYRAGLIGMPAHHAACNTAFTDRAKDCSMRKACFSGSWPAGK